VLHLDDLSSGLSVIDGDMASEWGDDERIGRWFGHAISRRAANARSSRRGFVGRESEACWHDLVKGRRLQRAGRLERVLAPRGDPAANSQRTTGSAHATRSSTVACGGGVVMP
jgi:hypothetical protein